MVSNIGKITDLAATPSKGLVDGTDKLHSGIIKVLESFSQDNMCVSHAGFTITDGGDYTQYNLAQPIKFRANGQYVSYTGGNLTVAYSSTVQDSTNSRYDWVLLNPNIGGTPAIVIVQGTAGTTPLVSDITAGYIPIALVHISAGTDDDKFDYSFQTFTMNLSKNSISIGYNDSGYTEAMSIVATADRTTFKNKVANADIRFILADNTADEKFEILSDDDSDGDEGDTEIFSVDGLGNTTITGKHSTDVALTVINSKDAADDETATLRLKSTRGTDSDFEIIHDVFGHTTLTSNQPDSDTRAHVKFKDDPITIFNPDGADIDLQVAGDTDSNLLYVNAGDDRVGIGVNAPDEKLHVIGNVKITNDLTLGGGDIAMGNGQDSTIKVDATTSSTAGRDLTIEAGSSATGSADINGGDLILKAGGGDGTGTSIMTFSTKVADTDVVAERMRISTTGKVGIGATAPTQTLGVNGSIGAASFVSSVVEITGNGSPPSPVSLLNLDSDTHRTIIADTQTSAPNPPNALSLTLPAASGTHQGWEMRIICKNNAGGPDNLTLDVTGSSDLIVDAQMATIGNASAGLTLATGKIYTVIHISATQYMAIQLN